MVDVLHTQLSAPIVSLPLKRHWFPYDARDTCQRARRGPADDTLAMEHKIEEALPCWSKNRRQITGARKRRAQKRGRRAKTVDQVREVSRWQIFIAVQHVECLPPLERVLPADANGGNSCLLKSHCQATVC